MDKLTIKGVHDEIAFWKKFIETDHFINEWEADKVCAEITEEQMEVLWLLKHRLMVNPEAKVLDAGSGVVSVLRGLVPDQNLIATDLLADEYAKFYNYTDKGIKKPLAIAAEDLPYENEFDIVHMRNALDHCQDAFAAFDALYNSCKPGGLIIIHGFKDEAIQEGWRGMHQWNISLSGKDLVISNKNKQVKHYTGATAFYKVLHTGKTWFTWIMEKK